MECRTHFLNFLRVAWNNCRPVNANPFKLSSMNSLLTDWYKAVQACVCLAFIANLAAVVALVVVVFTSLLPPRNLKNIGVLALVSAGKLLPPANEVDGKVMFSQVSVCSQGLGGHHRYQVPSGVRMSRGLGMFRGLGMLRGVSMSRVVGTNPTGTDT